MRLTDISVHTAVILYGRLIWEQLIPLSQNPHLIITSLKNEEKKTTFGFFKMERKLTCYHENDTFSLR